MQRESLLASSLGRSATARVANKQGLALLYSLRTLSVAVSTPFTFRADYVAGRSAGRWYRTSAGDARVIDGTAITTGMASNGENSFCATYAARQKIPDSITQAAATLQSSILSWDVYLVLGRNQLHPVILLLPQWQPANHASRNPSALRIPLPPGRISNAARSCSRRPCPSDVAWRECIHKCLRHNLWVRCKFQQTVAASRL